MSNGLHERLADALAAAIGNDGGLGFGAGEVPEPEPTAVAALALGDERARQWLLGRQHPSGGFALDTGVVENSATTALVALALPAGSARERALDYAVACHALVPEGLEGADPAWGWTPTSYSWTEPTARVLLAMRVLRPRATATIDEAERTLAQRECRHGGWNYGNRDALGTDLKPYVQTTAVAVIALQGRPRELAERGAAHLRAHWREERGGLTLAQTLVALRLADAATDDTTELEVALDQQHARTGFLGNQLTLAWAVLATAPDDRLDALRAAA
jgi:hypothetical protein